MSDSDSEKSDTSSESEVKDVKTLFKKENSSIKRLYRQIISFLTSCLKPKKKNK